MSDEGKFEKLDLSSLFRKKDFSFAPSPKGESLREAVIRLNVEKLPDFSKLNQLQAFGARLAMIAMQLGINMDYIDVKNLRRIADFGAGSGGPTFSLVAIAKAVSGECIALEENAKLANEISAVGILPSEQVIIEDGIDYLKFTETTGGKDSIWLLLLCLVLILKVGYFGDWLRPALTV